MKNYDIARNGTWIAHGIPNGILSRRLQASLKTFKLMF